MVRKMMNSQVWVAAASTPWKKDCQNVQPSASPISHSHELLSSPSIKFCLAFENLALHAASLQQLAEAVSPLAVDKAPPAALGWATSFQHLGSLKIRMGMDGRI